MASGAKPNQTAWSEWDFPLKIAANRVPHLASISKYGFNAAIVDATEDVWSNGGVLSFLSSAETMNIVSGSGDDKGTPTAGTGARTVTVSGLDANYKPVNEVVTLNGASNVLTTTAFLRVNRMRVTTAGTGGVNAGVITATASTAATVQAAIPIGAGSTFKSQYTVPAGFYCFIRNVNYGALNNDQAQFDFQTRIEGGPWITRDRIISVESYLPPPLTCPLMIAPKSDIRVQAIRIAGTGNVQCSVRYGMHLVKEEFVNSNSIAEDNT